MVNLLRSLINKIKEINNTLNKNIEDTGWINITPLNGFTGQIMYRKIGKIVRLNVYGSMPSLSSWVKIGQLPFNNSESVYIMGWLNGIAGYVGTNGNIEVMCQPAATSSVSVLFNATLFSDQA